MSQAFTALILHGDPLAAEAVRAALQRDGRVRVVGAANAADALGLARAERPGLVVVCAAAADGALDFCRGVKRDPELAKGLLLMVADVADPASRAAALESGADALLARPPDPEDTRAWLRIAMCLDGLCARAQADALEIERLRETLSHSQENLFALLVGVVDLGLPGAVDRGIRIAELARRLCERFGVPAALLPAVELAARLHELGHLVSPEARSGPRGGAPEGEAWQYTQSTVAILRQTDELQGVAELVANIYENWDGTGLPDHWRQGQIPLRCRILRVLIDFFAALERPGCPGPEHVLAELEEHVGTRYDPMVVVHLKALLSGASESGWRGSSVLLPITELHQGMVLAEDLYTDSGLKLLARDTTLTPARLEIILRRHRVEPILQGAAVVQKTA